MRVSDSDPEMLRYLDEQGIALGDRFEVVDAPAVRRAAARSASATSEHVLGRPLAGAMRVELD